MEKPNRDQITKLSYQDPLVAAVIKLVGCGELDYEQGLILMVTSLVNNNHELIEKLTKAYEILPFPVPKAGWGEPR